MRFCMVTTFYPPFHAGGDAVYVQALARALVRQGHDVEVVHCEDAFRIASHGHASLESTGSSAAADGDGVTVHRLRHPLGFLSPLFTQQTGRPGLKWKKLEALLGRGFDVIHYHNISLIGGPGVLRLGKARTRLYTLHDHWLLCPTHTLWKNRRHACDGPRCLPCSIRSGIPPQYWRYTKLVERELRHVDRLFAPSEFTARRHREAGIRRPIAVLPNFSRLDPGRAFVRGAPARPRFLFVGRVTASKGIALLTEAFAGLPQYDLWVAGGGDLLPALQQRFRGSANIRFLGRVEAAGLSELYGGASATIVPSLAPEVLALVVLESFAHKTPVLALDSGGCGEALRESGGGIVCNDLAELTAAIHAIAADPALGRELGWRGRQAYEQKYSEDVHVDAYLEHVASAGADAARHAQP